MLKKIFSGILFGLGFSVSCLVVYTVWIFWALPLTFSSQELSINKYSAPPHEAGLFPYIENFHELPLEEKIDKSTAILVTEISETDDGEYLNKVVEILKKEDGVDMFYNVGEAYDDYHPYDGVKEFIPSGYIVFMGGNPASMRYSVSYSGDRVDSLGGISLALLRKKCAT